MNAPARIAREAPAYDRDGYGWAIHQAALLKAKRFAEVDWDNVIDEIETVGRSERLSLRSNMVQVLVHVLKWDFQPERRGNSWWLSIMNHRDEAMSGLQENPSLRPELPAFLIDALRLARRTAAAEMKVHERALADLQPTLADVFDREFPQPDAN